MSEEENGETKTEITTPLGTVKIGGKKTAELITIMSLCVLFVLGYLMYEHKADAKEAMSDIKDVIKVMTEAHRETTAVQREMNCLLALPQEKREAEFYSPNSLCKRMSRN